MNKIKYLSQFFFITFLFLIFKIIGLRFSSYLSGVIVSIIGPVFRSNSLCHLNIARAFPKLNKDERKSIIKKMWFNYGRMLAEYMFIKDFRMSKNFSEKIIIENQEILENIKKSLKPVIFISGHFNNFELMAMHLEKSGIDLAAVYRPLNNKFLNPIMEYLRKKYICKNQIKKGLAGTKEVIEYMKKKHSIALMVDQRLGESGRYPFFNKSAHTTTLPAQLALKFNCSIIPIYLERDQNNHFKMEVLKPIEINKTGNLENDKKAITIKINKILEKMILRNPNQWIWTHGRWK